MTEASNKAAAAPDAVVSNPVVSVLVGPKWSWQVWLIWFLSFTAFFVVQVALSEHVPLNDYWMLLIIGFVTGSFGATFYYGIYFLIKKAVYRGTQVHAITQKTEVLQEDLEKDFFTNLVKINFKYLDKYYLQTQEQGDKSFLLCLIAALIGLVIISAGIVMMFFNKTNPAYITTGAGVLAEFIAAVFFYLYNQTVIKMSEYHQKLVLTQNIALALKITDDLPVPQKVDAQIGLIQALTKDVNDLLTQRFESARKA
jgi:H+/Cl- antiporter ClcA